MHFVEAFEDQSGTRYSSQSVTLLISTSNIIVHGVLETRRMLALVEWPLKV